MASADFGRADSDFGTAPESQTQTMQLTSNQYSTLSSLMNTSKTLITTLERSNILDRLVLFGAFAFFVAVCAHIFKKRVIDRGVHVVGALGGIVAKSGNAIAGVARRGGAAEEVAQEAKGVVIQGVADEWAKATTAAVGAAGAIRAGIDLARTKATQALHERNVPTQTPSRYHEEEAAAEPVDVLETVLPEEDHEPVVAAPVEVHEAVDDAGEPFHVFDEEMGLDEAIPGAAPTGEAFEPAAVEPLDEAFEEEEDEEDDALGFGLGEEGGEATLDPEDEGDDSLDDGIVQEPFGSPSAETEEKPDLPLAHDVDTVALRQPHPPTPSLPDLADLAFETPTAEEMPVQKPDLEEAVQAAMREEAEEGEEIASPVDAESASSDDEERIESDDIDSESENPITSVSEGDSSEPLDFADEEEIASADEQPQASARSFLADLPTDYSDLDLDAAPRNTVPVQSEEDSETQLPPLASTDLINEDDELPREVAGVDGTTTPLDVLDEADAPPALDVEGIGRVPADASLLSEEDRSVELPIDYAAEQTIWTDEAPEGSANAERRVAAEEEKKEEVDLRSSRESYEPHEQADEALLEELLERQMGGVGGGAYIPAHPPFNGTATHEDDNKAEVSPPDASAEVTPPDKSFYDSTPQSDSADEPWRDPHVTKSTTDVSIESDVDQTEGHIDPTEGLEVAEAIESATVPSTIEPTAAPILTSPPAVPEPTPTHDHSHSETSDGAAFDEVDATLDEEEESDEPQAEAADPEPLPSLPTQTAPDTFDPEATESAAGSDAQHRADETDEEDSPSTADAPSGVSTSMQSSPTVAPVDVEQVSREVSASSSATQPPPIPDHPIIANPKAAVEAGAVSIDELDVLESVLHDAPEPATLEVEPPASTSDEAAAASLSPSEAALPKQEDDESLSAFEASLVDGEYSELLPTEDKELEASGADFGGSTGSVANESGTDDEDEEEEERFDEEFDEEEVEADDAHAAPVHVEL